MIMCLVKGRHIVTPGGFHLSDKQNGPTQRQLSVNRFVQYGRVLKIHAFFHESYRMRM